MESRYKGANKSNKAFFRKILIIIVILAIFIFSEKYVSQDNSVTINETTNVVVVS